MSSEWITIGSVWKNENNMNGTIDTQKLGKEKYTITLNINKFKREPKHPDYNIR